MRIPYGLTTEEYQVVKGLSSPVKIQAFLDRIPYNHEESGYTWLSPRLVLAKRRAHCFEGALFAALALSFQGQGALILDLKTVPHDDDHVVALYRKNGLWGAISKTNHAVLRYRDPIYRSLRELALSYFHEYFDLKTGAKTLRSFSRPLDLFRFGTEWVTTDIPLDTLADALDATRHTQLFPVSQNRYLRPADTMEMRGVSFSEWPPEMSVKGGRKL